jgi:hypothetical protein
MKGKLIRIEKLENSLGTVRANTYQVRTNHFRAEYLSSEGAEIRLPSEHVGMTFARASSQIGTRLRGWDEFRIVPR